MRVHATLYNIRVSRVHVGTAHAGILSTLVAYSEAAREAVLSCKPSVLAQLTSAVQHGSPALATLSMGNADKSLGKIRLLC